MTRGIIPMVEISGEWITLIFTQKHGITTKFARKSTGVFIEKEVVFTISIFFIFIFKKQKQRGKDLLEA